MNTSPNERLALLGEIAAEIAHELRNALQVVSTSAFVGRTAPHKAQAQLERISRTTEGAQRLIDDLLDLARGDTFAREPVTVLSAIVSAREHLDPDRATYIDDIDAAMQFPLHPRLFARVLSVLFDNALAVSAGVPKVTTRATLNDVSLVVEVEDDGPGVPPDLGTRIFEPLVQGRAGGTGLGLSLASRIVRAHGGLLELKTVAPEGARFRIVLPR